jgi:DNA-binding SARP family transcriptional activator/tetratricopeptide (TPR) repeat protein
VAVSVQFFLLGPLLVRREGIAVPVPAGKQQVLLAALLLNANRPVGVGQLAETLWGSKPPPSARQSLQNHVMRLRRCLADTGRSRIIAQPDGYLIRIQGDELDVDRFEAALAVARQCARTGSWAEAAAVLRTGLAMWRGEPLAGVLSDALALREVPRLVEMRLQASEILIDAELHLDRHAHVIVDLERLVAAHPLRERLHALLMLALYRDGRQAEALTAYQHARRVLVDELGAEPGTELRELHRRILTADPSLTMTQPGAPVAGGAGAATRTLPRDTTSFTGRRDELARLVTAVTGAGEVVEIQAIGGMAGIGKTTLAVHAAHQLAPQFPDGQLFVPLHGHTPGRRPADPSDALASLLLAAGTPVAQIPSGLEERAARWRDQLSGRRVLLLLDDAASSEQVRPLLPGAGGSLVLVTSRRHLTALEDAQVISLDVLPARDAAALLVRLAGRPGLEPDDAATAEICALCGYLPLAIGMLARQLRHHPAWASAGLAADLAAARGRLEMLATENVSVAAGFDLSYADLTHDQRRLFRRLGLHPGSDIDAYAAAALEGTSLTAARRHLQGLYEHYLLTEPAEGRYRLHDLLRDHARGLAAREDPASDRDQALGRLLDYYTHTAALAETLLARQTQPTPAPALVAPPAAVPDLPDSARALTWAQTERTNLLACLDYATETGQHARVVTLTAAVAALLRQDGPWAEAVTRHATAVRAAQQSGDRPGQATAFNNLGTMRQRTGDYPGAAQALEAALSIYRDLGNQLGQANALSELGGVRRRIGDYPGAAQALEAALSIYRDTGDRLGQANSLLYLGTVRRLSGHYPGAADALETALSTYRDLGDRLGQAHTLSELGAVRLHAGDNPGAAHAQATALGTYRDLADRNGQANALNNLGIVRLHNGDYLGAAQALEEALSICRDLGNQHGQANALNNLGIVRLHNGDYPGAGDALDAALDMYRSIGDLGGEVEALNGAGTLHRVRGDLDRAKACHRRALDLAREIDSSWDEAHALAGLGRCALAANHAADARASLHQAHQIFQEIGSLETASLAIELDAVTEDE